MNATKNKKSFTLCTNLHTSHNYERYVGLFLWIVDGKYNVLLMGGGRGLFDFDEDFIRWLDGFCKEYEDKIHVTIVTGKNEKLFKFRFKL